MVEWVIRMEKWIKYHAFYRMCGIFRKELQDEIRKKASQYPSIYKDNDGYGNRYEQRIILYGEKGTPANVIVGWLNKPDGSTVMTSAYIKEVK